MSWVQRLRHRGRAIGSYRWWTISLRTCLVLMTVVAIALGLVTDRRHRREHAVRVIHESGGSVTSAQRTRVGELRNLDCVLGRPIRQIEFSPTLSERIFGDTYLYASVVERPVPSEAISAIACLSELAKLELHTTDITDSDLAQLRGLRRLEYLGLSKCPISDDSAPLIGSYSELRWLELNQTTLSDRSVPSLMQLTKLEVLRIQDTNFTEQGIMQLASLKNLRALSIGSADRTASKLPMDILRKLNSSYPHLQVSN